MSQPDSAAVAQLEKRILNETVAANRNASAAVAFILAVAGLALVANIHNLREVPLLSMIGLGLGLALLIAMPILMMLRPQEDAYPLVRFWVALVGVMVAGQIVNFLFGDEREVILQRGWPPVLLVCVPLYLLIARAFLIRRHAHFIQWFFLAVLASVTLFHWFLYAKDAHYTYGMSLLAITVCLIGPLMVVLLDLQLRVQGTAYRALQAELLSMQRRHDAKHQLQLMDDFSGLLNQQGIQEALELALDAYQLTGLARIEVSNVASIQQFCEPADYEHMLREIAHVLKQGCGVQLAAGRWSDAQFLVWGKIAESPEHWQQRVQALANEVVAAFADGHILPDIESSAHVAEQGSSLALAVEKVGLA